MNKTVSIKELKGRIDFAIITIREDEFNAVLSRFSPRKPVTGGKQFYEYCLFKTQCDVECGIAIVKAIHQGHNSAHSVTRDVIEELDPKWLILAGIAGGVPDHEFSLGDVLLANYLHDSRSAPQSREDGRNSTRPVARFTRMSNNCWPHYPLG